MIITIFGGGEARKIAVIPRKYPCPTENKSKYPAGLANAIGEERRQPFLRNSGEIPYPSVNTISSQRMIFARIPTGHSFLTANPPPPRFPLCLIRFALF